MGVKVAKITAKKRGLKHVTTNAKPKQKPAPVEVTEPEAEAAEVTE